MSYGISKEVRTDVESTGSLIQPGIHENIMVEDLKFEVTENQQKETLVFTLVDDAGRKLSKRIFSPEGSQYFDAEERRVNKLIGNLARAILNNQEYATEEVDSFADFCKKVITDIGDKYKTARLRVKVVVDKKRPTFPDVSRFVPVFENMSVPKEQSHIRVMSENPYNESIEYPKPSEPSEVSVEITAGEDVF